MSAAIRVYRQGYFSLRELNLDGAHLDFLGSSANRVCAALGKADATKLARLDVFVGCAHADLNGSGRVHSRRFEDVQLLFTVQYSQALIDRAADVLWAAVWLHASLNQSTFDRDDNFGS